MKISISLDPTDLEYSDGSRYDVEKLLARLREFVLAKYPDARITTLQVGHRQGDCWSLVDGDEDLGSDLTDAFWAKHAADEDLYV